MLFFCLGKSDGAVIEAAIYEGIRIDRASIYSRYH